MNVFKLLKYLLVDAFTFYGGGGKGGGSAPSAPDPNVVAAATTKTNTDTAAFNKALNLNNYSNPFGSQQTVQTGVDPKTGAPIYNTQITANPQLQDSLSSLLGQASNSGNINSSALSGLQSLGGQYGNLGSQYSNVANQYGNLNQGISGLGSQYSNISNQIGGLQGQYGALNSQYSGLGSQLAGLGSQLDQGAAKAAQQQGQDAAYKAQTQYLDPQFSQQGESLGAQLANQGLAPGSQAYSNAMTNYNNTKQQAYSNAQNQAIMTGSQLGAQNLQNQIAGINTQSGLIGQQAGLLGQRGNNLGAQAGLYGQQAGLVGNQAGLFGLQGNNLAGQLGAYGQMGSNLGAQAGLYGQQVGIGQTPYSNLGSIASMIPGYSGTGQSSANPADIAGLYNNQYQSQLANYNAQQQSANNTQSGLMGLGQAGMMAFALSDRRAKRAIKRVATWANGLGVYTYRYKWEPKGVRHLGFMADEVRKIAPLAVVRGKDGFDRVNYQLAGSAK